MPSVNRIVERASGIGAADHLMPRIQALIVNASSCLRRGGIKTALGVDYRFQVYHFAAVAAVPEGP